MTLEPNGAGTVSDLAPDPNDLATLSACGTQADKIRYACERNRPNPTTMTVRDWLARHGITTGRSYASTIVNAWRNNIGLSDTGDLPALSAEMLAELDANRERDLNASDRHPRTRPERVPNTPTASPETTGAKGFYVAAALSLFVSFDTSWRFFEHVLHITALWERAVMFTVLEAALIACGYGMRANVARTGRPGAPRLFAWLLCAMAGYMAWQLSGVAAGIARVALGPALGLVMLHLALGIEIRARHTRTTIWARIGRELRERLLSRLGLADDGRDAHVRTRDRAARRVARLALAPKRATPFQQARLNRAIRTSSVAHDPNARARMLAELTALRHAKDLATLPQTSPWNAS